MLSLVQVAFSSGGKYLECLVVHHIFDVLVPHVLLKKLDATCQRLDSGRAETGLTCSFCIVKQKIPEGLLVATDALNLGAESIMADASMLRYLPSWA